MNLRNVHGSHRQRTSVFAGVLALVMLISACTSSSSPSSQSTKGGGSQDSTFIYAVPGIPDTLDLWTNYEGDSHRVQDYEWGSRLVNYDMSKVPNQGCGQLATSADMKPMLAESWEYSADKKQLIFHVRPNVKSAAGNTLTSADMLWSLERAEKTSSIVQFLLYSVADFQKTNTFAAPDANTFVVNVAKPTALDIAIFTWPQLEIQDSKVVKAHAPASDPLAKKWLTTHMANFGPWQLESFTPNQQTVYTENPNYWDKANRGNFTKLVFQNVSDASTRLQLLETGQATLADRLSFDQYAQLEKSGSAKVYDCVSPTRDTLLLNEANPELAKPDVRKAISMAIDRDALVKGVYKGYGKAATTGLSPVYWQPPADAKKYEYNPQKAKQLLAQAGASSMKLQILAAGSRPGAWAQSLATQIQSMLKNVGIDASLKIIAGATDFSNLFFDKKYAAMIYSEPPAVADPFYSLNLYNTTASFQNTFGYKNDQYNSLADEILHTAPGPDRDQLMLQVSNLILDTTPQVYLVEEDYVKAFAKGITGFTNVPNGAVLVHQLHKQ